VFDSPVTRQDVDPPFDFAIVISASEQRLTIDRQVQRARPTIAYSVGIAILLAVRGFNAIGDYPRPLRLCGK
jgi:hypothetical protein